MNPEQIIHARLASDSELAELITGIYPTKAEENPPELPYLIYTISPAEVTLYCSGTSNLRKYGVAIEAYAITLKQCIEILNRVDVVLNNWRGGNVQLCKFDSSSTQNIDPNNQSTNNYQIWINTANVTALPDSTGTITTGSSEVVISACDNNLTLNCFGLFLNGQEMGVIDETDQIGVLVGDGEKITTTNQVAVGHNLSLSGVTSDTTTAGSVFINGGEGEGSEDGGSVFITAGDSIGGSYGIVQINSPAGGQIGVTKDVTITGTDSVVLTAGGNQVTLDQNHLSTDKIIVNEVIGDANLSLLAGDNGSVTMTAGDGSFAGGSVFISGGAGDSGGGVNLTSPGNAEISMTDAGISFVGLGQQAVLNASGLHIDDIIGEDHLNLSGKAKTSGTAGAVNITGGQGTGILGGNVNIEGGDGVAKGLVTIEGRNVILTNGNKSASITDLGLTTSNIASLGSIDIAADASLSLTGDDISLTTTTGSVSIYANDDFILDITNDVSMVSGGPITLTSPDINLTATTVDCSGTLTASTAVTSPTVTGTTKVHTPLLEIQNQTYAANVRLIDIKDSTGTQQLTYLRMPTAASVQLVMQQFSIVNTNGHNVISSPDNINTTISASGRTVTIPAATNLNGLATFNVANTTYQAANTTTDSANIRIYGTNAVNTASEGIYITPSFTASTGVYYAYRTYIHPTTNQTDLVAFNSEPGNAASNVSNIWSFRHHAGAQTSGTIGNLYGFYAYTPTASGTSTITNSYSIFLQSQKVGSTVHHAFYGDKGKYRFGDNSADTQIGFHGATPVAKPTVTGSRGGNAALASLLTQLATIGLITDSTTA